MLELARHLGLNDQETRQLLEASLTALSSYWHLPSPRNPFFTGREDILDTLHQCLSTNQAVALTRSYVLHGLGGIGKTQIAVEYAYRHAQEYTAVFWIGAETPESLASSFLSIATLLGLPEHQESDQGRIAAAVRRWLSTHRQWLLIWDNVEDLDLLSSFLPPARQGAMLFTTRRQTLGTLAHGMELQPMMEEEGTLFLLRRARLLDPTAPVEQLKQLAQRTPFEYAAARELVAAMDGLPLALDQVGAYVQETPCSLADYLKLYQTRRAELLKRRGEVVIDHPASVVTTWSISFEKVEQANAPAAAHAQAGWKESSSFAQAGRKEDVFLWHEAIRAVSPYSLLKRNTEEHTLSIHRLVQAVLRERMSEQECELWQQRAIRMLNAVFPEVPPDTQRQCERLLPHCWRVQQPCRFRHEGVTWQRCCGKQRTLWASMARTSRPLQRRLCVRRPLTALPWNLLSHRCNLSCHLHQHTRSAFQASQRRACRGRPQRSGGQVPTSMTIPLDLPLLGHHPDHARISHS